MAAGVGCGIYKNLIKAAEELLIWDRMYEPNMDNKKIYDSIKIKWEEAYKIQLQLVDKEITVSMWKAPGL